jgi:hypothetical protein
MLAAAANGQFLVAPDNGVAGLFLDEYVQWKQVGDCSPHMAH